MTTARRLGFLNPTRREVALLNLSSIDAPLTLDPACFNCFCAVNAENLTVDAQINFCNRLWLLGCVYFAAWGPGCERLHDIMDEVALGDTPYKNFRCVMTTWHHEPLDEALDFFLTCANPHDDFAAEGCDLALLISVGSDDFRVAIERLASPALKR